MWGIRNEENKVNKWLVSPDGVRKEYYTKQEAGVARDLYYPDCEVKRLPEKPVYGITSNSEKFKWIESSSGTMFWTASIGVAMAWLKRCDCDDYKIAIFGENGEPVDIE